MSSGISDWDHDTSVEPSQKNGHDIATLNIDRLETLRKLDEAEFSRFHLKVSLVAGVGFFTDAYDISVINIASVMLGYVYGTSDPAAFRCSTIPFSTGLRVLGCGENVGLKAATPIGNIFGQFIFGWLADHFGRKRMYGVELMIIVISTFAQAMAGQGLAMNVVASLIVWRFIMGIGIGADYPVSAVIASEFASARTRGRLMTAVFANQGWGQLTGAIVAIVVVAAYGDTLHEESLDNLKSVDTMWRLLIGLGIVPGVVALYFRLTIAETPRFTMDVERNIAQATRDVENFLTTGDYFVDPDASIQRVTAPKASGSDFFRHFFKWENASQLVGCLYSWFALDIAYYYLLLNYSVVLDAIHFGTSTTGLTGTNFIYTNLMNVSLGNLVVTVAGSIPGYWATFFLIDRWGRKPIQLMGFVILTNLFIIMGFAYDKLVNTTAASRAFMLLLCLTNFFANFGPNTTTFIIPGEAFPTRYRSTCHGLAAASGKLGAVISQVGFVWMTNIHGQNAFMGHILEILAFFMLTGVFSTLLMEETKQRTLENISNEPQEEFITDIMPLEKRA